MAERPAHLVVCSCQGTVPLDLDAIQRGCAGARVTAGGELCRAERDTFSAAAEQGEPLVVGCTQEAPLFSELAAASAVNSELKFANIRETAGWSNEAGAAGPKMAALLAAAAEPMPEFAQVRFESEGALLIYGQDEAAIEAADLLKDHLDVTVLIKPPAQLAPRRVTDFPLARGTVRAAQGHFGAFELTVDGYAQPVPSSRGELGFAGARDGVVSHCDLILDLSGGAALFSAADLRDGYLRADPGDGAAVLKTVLKARDLVGTFDKPRYIGFTADLCAHSRSRITGCTRCLDLCPAGAIVPAGDHVDIDEHICAGCGQCATVCPTGAASYALPPVDALIRKLRVLLTTYRQAGGANPIVLLHDEAHGTPLIDALARFGDGLPANVLPFAVNEVTQVGLESIASAFAYGAAGLRLLTRARPRHNPAALHTNVTLAETILLGLGFGPQALAVLEIDDPEELGAVLRRLDQAERVRVPATFLPVGGKRDILQLALRELHRAAPAPVDIIALPQGAPFGAVRVDTTGCTLCLACVAACPTGALGDDPERPMLRFAEHACVQCGLCKATCPEKVITLVPQLDFGAATLSSRVLNEEEPFCCIRCGKPFGVKSTIERVTAKLAGTHWMFANAAERLEVIRMCEDCRVIAVTEQELDPHGAPPRPRMRTTEDYLREREQAERRDKPSN